MTTYLGKSCSFCLPRVPFVNCRQFMYLVISLLVLRAGYGIWLYQFLIIAYLFTLSCTSDEYPPVCINLWLMVSGSAVVSQNISELHGRDLHWRSSISRQAGPPPCNTHSVKCYAPVICNHVSWGIAGILVFLEAKPSKCPAFRGHFCSKHPAQISIGKCIKSRWRSNVESKAPQLFGTVGMMLRLKHDI